MTRIGLYTALVMVCALVSTATAQDAEKDANTQDVKLAPGWGKLSFSAPPAGSYHLPALEQAAGGKVLNVDGEAVELASLLGGKPTLLSFIYRTCDDVNGCPLSTMVLYQVGNRVAEDPQIKDRLRLITLSFDPQGDTPMAMQEYRDSLVGDAALDWHFLTTESEKDLAPILTAYQQSVIKDKNSKDGKGKFSHILRVYLIDAEQQIRNIYSLSFLHPDILLNDVKTLIMETSEPSAAPTSASHNSR